jgi:hypothetical protein
MNVFDLQGCRVTWTPFSFNARHVILDALCIITLTTALAVVVFIHLDCCQSKKLQGAGICIFRAADVSNIEY